VQPTKAGALAGHGTRFADWRKFGASAAFVADMKPALALVFAVCALAAPAAAVAGPGLPTNCHELNALLHIDNVRDCDNGS
jgi:hypothetical protein